MSNLIREKDVSFPKMAQVRQIFPGEKVKDLSYEINKQLQRGDISNKIKKDSRVAIAVGSRGIPQIDEIVSYIASEVSKKGGIPFIVPAMGSHGGATSEGQQQVLESYGLSEEILGTPIKSSMETIEIGRVYDSVPIYFDRIALEADAIIPINKVALHTAYRGEVESGLTKMLCIGLGKHKGAKTLHRQGMEAFHNLMIDAGKLILSKAPVVFGIAILQNAYGEIAQIEAVAPNEIIQRDKELLSEYSRIRAKILLDDFDILIVDYIGKDISGEGMDPNVARRFLSMEVNIEKAPQKIVVLNLTQKTMGNAIGIGIADLTTEQLVNKIDYDSTYTNTITTKILPLARIPITCKDDQEAIMVALNSCTGTYALNPRVVRIKNTRDLEKIEVSENLLPQVEKNEAVILESHPGEMVFGENGLLSPLKT